MPKLWKDLSQPEKVEDLRRDVVMLINAVNKNANDLRALSSHVGEVGSKVLKVEEELQALKAQLKK